MATTVTLNDNALITTTEAENFVWDEPDDRTDDEKDILYAMVNAISNAIEDWLNRKIINAEVTEYHDGGNEVIPLDNFPIVSIDSVYEDGDELTPEANHGETNEDYDYYEEQGIVYSTSGRFDEGRQIIKVTYTAGLGADNTEIPDNIKLACKVWVKQVMEGDIENFGTIITEGTMVRPSNMPALTRLLLQAYKKRTG
jgi:hypothetical protein